MAAGCLLCFLVRSRGSYKLLFHQQFMGKGSLTKSLVWLVDLAVSWLALIPFFFVSGIV